MIIKKFQADTKENAMVIVKKELGNNAIVMNMRTVRPKGFRRFIQKSSVEVTAAVEENMRSRSDGEEMLEKIRKISDLTKESMEQKQKEETISEMEKRLDRLQEQLKQQWKEEQEKKERIQKKEQKEKKQNQDCILLVRKQLQENEVADCYIDQILEEIEGVLKKNTQIQQIISSVYQKIVLKLGKIDTIKAETGKTKFIFFVGPTGVGKTTTIAKIASDFKMKQNKKVAFITSDTYRIAAVEQLRTYANILEIPIHVVYTEEDILKARESLMGYDLVFVDTPGCSHRSKELKEKTMELIQAIPEEEKEVYLVLSMTTKYKELIKIIEAYESISNEKIIFTKADETSTLGNILNVRMKLKKQLSYITTGQNVPDDIQKINVQKVAKQLLEEND